MSGITFDMGKISRRWVKEFARLQGESARLAVQTQGGDMDAALVASDQLVSQSDELDAHLLLVVAHVPDDCLADDAPANWREDGGLDWLRQDAYNQLMQDLREVLSSPKK